MTRLIKPLIITALLTFGFAGAQSISSEKISFSLLKAPKISLDASKRTFSATVVSPYNLTIEDVKRISKEEFKKKQDNYANEVLESKMKYQEALKNHDSDIRRAKEKFEMENAAFKKLSLLEKMTLMDRGQSPKLVVPDRPTYQKPYPPTYREPNLNDYFIVDNKVLSSQIDITGFTRGAPNVDINIEMSQVNFQDNAGQTYANQPTKLIIKVDGEEKVNESLFSEFQFVSSSSTDNIDKVNEEKNVLQKTIKNLNKYINDYFGIQKISKDVIIQTVKNKGTYNDLEKANIYITTNLKKLQANPDSNATEVAIANMQKGIDIWKDVLTKINYTDPKAVYNNEIARYIYFNLIRLHLALGNKTEAEKYLNEMQEHQVELKLSSSEKQQLDTLEKEIYKSK